MRRQTAYRQHGLESRATELCKSAQPRALPKTTSPLLIMLHATACHATQHTNLLQKSGDECKEQRRHKSEKLRQNGVQISIASRGATASIYCTVWLQRKQAPEHRWRRVHADDEDQKAPHQQEDDEHQHDHGVNAVSPLGAVLEQHPPSHVSRLPRSQQLHWGVSAASHGGCRRVPSEHGQQHDGTMNRQRRLWTIRHRQPALQNYVEQTLFGTPAACTALPANAADQRERANEPGESGHAPARRNSAHGCRGRVESDKRRV